MALLPDGLYVAWSAAGGFATLALATGGRAIFTQWRANARSGRQAEDWTAITDAVSACCNGDKESADVVLRALKRPSSQRIAIEALANLARVDSRVPQSLRGQTEIVEQIREWVARELSHSDPGRRCAGAEIVGALRLRACRGAVAMATADPEAEVRVAACRALAVVDPDHAVGVLLGLVERDGVWAADLLADIVSREDGAFSGSDAVAQRANDWAATPALLRLLSNGRIAGAQRVMIGALDAEDDSVRASAADALRESGTSEAVRALSGLLGDTQELIRLTAVKSIGESRDPAYSMDLAAMLGDESRLVRFAAGSALAAMPGGRDLLVRAAEGSDPKAVEAANVSLWQADQADQAAGIQEVESVERVEQSGRDDESMPNERPHVVVDLTSITPRKPAPRSTSSKPRPKSATKSAAKSAAKAPAAAKPSSKSKAKPAEPRRAAAKTQTKPASAVKKPTKVEKPTSVAKTATRMTNSRQAVAKRAPARSTNRASSTRVVIEPTPPPANALPRLTRYTRPSFDDEHDDSFSSSRQR